MHGNARFLIRPITLGVIVSGMLGAAQAQDAAHLDVPYVPTPQAVVTSMLELAKVTSNDFHIDLGCGDGRIAVTAAKDFGARSLGIDLDPRRVAEATENAKQAGVSSRATFRQQNLFDADISDATVVTMYLLPSVNLQLRPRILSELAPGTRVVSHAFNMGDWTADRTETIDRRTIYLWVVPAQIEGRWLMKQGNRDITLDIQQQYQTFSGTAMLGDRVARITNGRLNGPNAQFVLQIDGNPMIFSGRVSGNTINGLGSVWTASKRT